MDYKVYNTDTNYWMTYRKDYDGHYSVVHEGLPRVISGYYWENYPTIKYCEPCYCPRPKRISIYRRRRPSPCRYCPFKGRRIVEIDLNY